ncbi:MAG: hypothetical protein QW478_00845 [Candidatus Micrarchaeaceae archaeon]
MGDKSTLFLINLYMPVLGYKVKSNGIKEIFNNKYKNIYKINWTQARGPNSYLVKNGTVKLDQDVFLDIFVNLSFTCKSNYGVVFLRNNEILYASEGNKVLNFSFADVFKMCDKLKILILTNNDINFFDLGCNWYLGVVEADFVRVGAAIRVENIRNPTIISGEQEIRRFLALEEPIRNQDRVPRF